MAQAWTTWSEGASAPNGTVKCRGHDKFKIIITLRRAQKFGDTGPYKNFDFLNNPLVPEFFLQF